MLQFLRNLRKDCEQFDLEANGQAHNVKGTTSVERIDWAANIVNGNHDLLANTLEDLSDSMLAVSHHQVFFFFFFNFRESSPI